MKKSTWDKVKDVAKWVRYVVIAVGIYFAFGFAKALFLNAEKREELKKKATEYKKKMTDLDIKSSILGEKHKKSVNDKVSRDKEGESFFEK